MEVATIDGFFEKRNKFLEDKITLAKAKYRYYGLKRGLGLRTLKLKDGGRRLDEEKTLG